MTLPLPASPHRGTIISGCDGKVAERVNALQKQSDVDQNLWLKSLTRSKMVATDGDSRILLQCLVCHLTSISMSGAGFTFHFWEVRRDFFWKRTAATTAIVRFAI